MSRWSVPAAALLALITAMAGPAVGPAAGATDGAAMPPNPYAGPDGT